MKKRAMGLPCNKLKESDAFQKTTVILLGEFRLRMSYLHVIGRHFRNIGLFDLVVESGVIARGAMNAVLEGKRYNRSLRAKTQAAVGSGTSAIPGV